MSQDEHLTEAERLMKLPPGERDKIVALHKAIADDPDVPEADRRLACERADALQSHLRRLFWRQMVQL